MSDLNSLSDIFKKEILYDQTKTLKEQYWIVVELQTELKKIFMYYYEYELFRLVLQDYYDGLQKVLNPSRVKKFKKKSSSSLSRNKHIVYNTVNYNTVNTNTKTKRYRFGEPLTDPTLLETSTNATFFFSLPQEEEFVSANYTRTIKRKLNCDFDYFLLNNELYDIEIIPHVGSVVMEGIFHYYLYMQHQKIHRRDNPNVSYKAVPCEIFSDFCWRKKHLYTHDTDQIADTPLIDGCP